MLDAGSLQVLQQLPTCVSIVAAGQTLADFASLSDDQWRSVNVLLNCGVGKNAGKKEHIQVGRMDMQISRTVIHV